MKNKTLSPILSYWFNWLMIKITKPKTKITSFGYGLNKNFFNLNGVPKWKRLKRIDNIIAESINTYHKPLFKGESLYNITSVWALRTALNVIKYNIAKDSDFSSSNEPATVIKHFQRDFFGIDKYLYNRFFDDNELQDLARKNSSTQDGFYDLMFDFSEYLFDQAKYQQTNEWIKETIIDNSISEYLGQNLYKITDEKLLDEGVRAIRIMHDLLQKGLTTYQGVNISDLSLFNLKKLRIEYNDADYSNIIFDDTVRKTYQTHLALQTKLEKRNEQARKRRAKQKAASKKLIKKPVKSSLQKK